MDTMNQVVEAIQKTLREGPLTADEINTDLLMAALSVSKNVRGCKFVLAGPEPALTIIIDCVATSGVTIRWMLGNTLDEQWPDEEINRRFLMHGLLQTLTGKEQDTL